MLNMKAMPAAQGGRLAAYLWKEAVEDLEPWVAKTDLDYYASQVAQGWVEFEDVVDLEYAKRLARVEAAGVTDIDHAMLRDKASDDVTAAILRYEAAKVCVGVEYRQDTSPELAALLKIDLDELPRRKDLMNLLSGGTTEGDQPEGKRRYRTTPGKKRNTMGCLGLMFSADKSVSVIFGLSSAEERAAIVAAQRAAVDVALHQIAEKLSFLRARRDGLDHRDPADITWVQWQHRQSRRGDPQLHTHVTIPNVVRSRVDGKVGTLDTFALNGFYPIVRETYHRALAAELRKLDLSVEFDHRIPAAVITGMPKQVLRHFSGRTTDGEAWLQKQGVNFASLTPHARSTWLNHATRKTRPRKATYYVPGNGHTAWHARAAGQGYVPPPRFVDPQALQRAGIVHVSVDQAQALRQVNITHGRVERTQQRRGKSQAIRPQLDSRYNVGGGHYDDTSQKHGRSL